MFLPEEGSQPRLPIFFRFKYLRGPLSTSITGLVIWESLHARETATRAPNPSTFRLVRNPLKVSASLSWQLNLLRRSHQPQPLV